MKGFAVFALLTLLVLGCDRPPPKTEPPPPKPARIDFTDGLSDEEESVLTKAIGRKYVCDGIFDWYSAGSNEYGEEMAIACGEYSRRYSVTFRPGKSPIIHPWFGQWR